MKRFEKFFDKWGLLSQSSHKNRDGGDSCSRTCAFYFLLGLLRTSRFEALALKVENALYLYESPTKPNNYARHPNPNKWYGNVWYSWQYFSRDQAVPLVLCMGVYGEYRRLFGFTLQWLKRCMWMTNIRKNWMYPTKELHDKYGPKHRAWDFGLRVPDFAPQLLGCIIRAFYPYSIIVYPVLWITDLELLFSAGLKVLFQSRMRKMQNGDQQNYVLRLIQAQYFLPTLPSALARWIYVSFSGYLDKSPEGVKYTPRNGVQSRLQWFFREGKGDPPLDLVFRPIVENW